MSEELEQELASLVMERGSNTLEGLIKRANQLHTELGGTSPFEVELRLANALKRQGNYKWARQLYEKLGGLIQKESREEVALANNYGALMQDTGDYDGALALYQQSLEIARRIFGPEHPSVATTMNNMAAVYEARGDLDHALALYQESLEIAERILGENHPDVASILNNVASVLIKLRRNIDAINYLQRALQIMENSLGTNHKNSLILRANLASLKKKGVQNAEQGAPADARTSRR